MSANNLFGAIAALADTALPWLDELSRIGTRDGPKPRPGSGAGVWVNALFDSDQ